MAVKPGLCVTWSEIPKTGFLETRFILNPGLCGTFDGRLDNDQTGKDGIVHRWSRRPDAFVESWRFSLYEPRCEKTGLRGFRPGPTKTGLCSHR